MPAASTAGGAAGVDGTDSTAGSPPPAGGGGSGSAVAGQASTGPGQVVQATPAPTPTTVVVTGSSLHLGPDDYGRTFRVRRGTTVLLELTGTWDAPATDDPSVLVPTAHTGGYPDPGPVSASYTAAAPGTAHITATSDAACLHTNPRCMIAQRDYRVTVVVRN